MRGRRTETTGREHRQAESGVGSVVAPVWGATGGGSAMGSEEERKRFFDRFARHAGSRRSCASLASGRMAWFGSIPRPARPNGLRIRMPIRSASPKLSRGLLDRRRPGGKASGRRRNLLGRDAQLERDARAARNGGSAEDAGFSGRHGAYSAVHTGLQRAGGPYSAGRISSGTTRGIRLSAEGAYRALRPWTIDFHVAQNDATVKGSGSHDKTGHHCLPFDPNGKLNIVRACGLLDERRTRETRRRLQAHLLGWMYVPEST